MVSFNYTKGTVKRHVERREIRGVLHLLTISDEQDLRPAMLGTLHVDGSPKCK